MKKVRLAGYDIKLLEEIKSQLHIIFRNDLVVELWLFDQQKRCEDSETITLVFSSPEYHYAKGHTPIGTPIVIGQLMITEKTHAALRAVPSHRNVSFCYLSETLSVHYINHLYSYDYPFVIDPISINKKHLGDAVLLIPNYLEDLYAQVTNDKIILDTFILDRHSLIKLGFMLNLDDVINPQNLLKSYIPAVTSDIALTEILRKNNMFESELEILSLVLDEGIIAIDHLGITHIYNDQALKVFKIPRKDIIGFNGLESFSMLGFESALRGDTPPTDKLIMVNGQNLIISVHPIFHTHKLYGAVATIKRFSDEEVKQHRFRQQVIGKGHHAKYTFDHIKGHSQIIEDQKKIAFRMAQSQSSILITGESGTGKELFAQAIHASSKRKQFQFVAINCGALPESLLESELFGYEEGSFTGARKGGKPGLFELAHKGTLFLDEIGEMPTQLQLRLLRVLQEREVMRIGSDRLIKVDIRIIAATNKHLQTRVKEGHFREDLYYRLNVLPLKLPSLKDHINDLDALILAFKRTFNSSFEIHDSTLKLLKTYHWPGNVRELKNYIEYWAHLDTPVIMPEDIPFSDFENMAQTDTHSDNKVLFETYISESHRPLILSKIILDSLHKAKLKGIRLGRRTLHQEVLNQKQIISEQEVRKILLHMEHFGFVEVLKGRGGTILTMLGSEAREYFNQN